MRLDGKNDVLARILTVLLLAGPAQAFAQGDGSVDRAYSIAVDSEVDWHGLRLNVSRIGDTRVLWHQDHEPVLDSLEAALLDHAHAIRLQREALAELSDRRDDVIAWLGDRIGPDDLAQAAGESTFNTLLQFYSDVHASLKQVPVVLIPREEAIRLLNEGVAIDGFVLSTDGQGLQMQLDEERLVDLSELVLPLRRDDPDAAKVPASALRVLRGFDLWPGVLLHEAAEAMILVRAKSRRPHLRWFTDGMANVFTVHGLAHFGQQDAADRFKDHWLQAAKDIDPTKTYLAFWLNASYTPVFEPYYEQALTSARYALATTLCEELLESIGDHAARKVLDQFAARRAPSSGLLDAIREVGGEAAVDKVRQYQPKETRVELMRMHEASLERAYSAGNLILTERHLMRIIELDLSEPDNHHLALMLKLAELIEQTQGRAAADRMLDAARNNLQGLGLPEEEIAQLCL
ncbi:MAG: hypothetical protein AAF663_03880 [Planctomycetota bacterium]